MTPQTIPHLTPQEVLTTISDGLKLIESLPEIKQHVLVGSALYALNPQDVDFLVLLDHTIPAMGWNPVENAADEGWEECGDYDTEHGKWRAIRKGKLNLIVTSCPVFYKGMLTASEVCWALNLTEKRQRLLVHRVVRDGFGALEAMRLVAAGM